MLPSTWFFSRQATSETARDVVRLAPSCYDTDKEMVMIELNEAQRQSLQQGNPVRVVVPDVGADCVVVRADVYERLRSVLEED